MKCSICKTKLNEYIPILFGAACPDCANKLPQSAKDNISMLSAGKIKTIQSIFKDPISTPWYAFGPFKVCDHSIILSGRELALDHLDSIQLNFHQTKIENGKIFGWLSLLIRTKNPAIELEESFYRQNDGDGQAFPYQNGSIVYPQTLNWIIQGLQKAVVSGNKDLSEIKKQYQEKASEKHKEKQKAYEEKSRRERERWERERFHKESEKTQNTGYSGQQQNQQNDQNKQNSKYKQWENRKRDPFENKAMDLPTALKLYDVTMPYKTSEIKKKRNQLLKKFHPDEGGDPEMSKKINTAYEILCKYAEN